VALIVLSVLLGAGAAVSIRRVLALLRGASPLATTLAELKRDEATLGGGPSA